MTSTAILPVEGYSIVRRGVRLLLEAEPDFEVCGGVSTLAKAIEGCWEPAVILHELLLSDATGPEVVAKLHGRFPDACLVVFSRLDNPTYVHLAMASGARGYVLKSAAPEALTDAVRRVAAGEECVEPSLGAALAHWDGIPRRRGAYDFLALTRREQEVLDSSPSATPTLRQPRTWESLCARSSRTASHIVQELGLRTRAELVQFVTDRRQATDQCPRRSGPGPRLSRRSRRSRFHGCGARPRSIWWVGETPPAENGSVSEAHTRWC